MNAKRSVHRKWGRILTNILSLLAILAIALPVTQVAYAASVSPFVGNWQATDVDGSDIRLSIGGPPSGPFQITWTEDYISFCDGEAGIVRGTAQLNESDPNLLEADLYVECFTTGASMNFPFAWRYHPLTSTLSSRYENGAVTIWHRPGRPEPTPLELGLRVNYGHDWVESFYEGGHTAWITVTESDGVTVKATAELATEPKDFWGGETGFNTQPEDWVPAPPDIQPNDWVFGWLDNGASAQVQIGDINGMIDLATDSIQGTVNAPWFSDEVQVECHSWGAPLPEEILKYDWVQPNGEDTYSCSWADEWDIEPYQDVGVGYFVPDGHWIANAFIAPNPRIVASEAGDWYWMTEFYPGLLDLSIYVSAEEGAALLWSGQQETTDQWGITMIESHVHGQDLVPGNYLVVSDGVNEKGLVLETITVEVFDTENEIMAGTATLGREVWAMAGPQDWQQPLMVQADSVSGAWLADFKTLPEPFDITEDMRTWSYTHIYDEDGDANEAGMPPPTPAILAWLEWDTVDVHGLRLGDPVTLTVGDLVLTQHAEINPNDPNQIWAHFDVGAAGHDLVIGDWVQVSDSQITKELLIPEVKITDYDLGANTISGLYGPMLGFRTHVYDQELIDVVFDGSMWTAYFDDLGPLMWGDAVQTDADGDEVSATIRTPNPMFYVVPDEERIFASEWSPGQNLVVSVNGVQIASQVVPDAGSPYGPEVLFDLNGVFDLQAGQTVTLTDGRSTKELIVPLLEVKGFDLAGPITISGIANPGPYYLEIHSVHIMDIIVGEDGNWSASSPEFDSGEWGAIIQTDDDGDQIRDIFMVPWP